MQPNPIRKPKFLAQQPKYPVKRKIPSFDLPQSAEGPRRLSCACCRRLPSWPSLAPPQHCLAPSPFSLHHRPATGRNVAAALPTDSSYCRLQPQGPQGHGDDSGRSSRSRSAMPTMPMTPLLPPQPPGHADHAPSPVAVAGPSWIGSVDWQAWSPRTAARGRNHQKLVQAAATSPLFRSHQDKDLNQIHQPHIKCCINFFHNL